MLFKIDEIIGIIWIVVKLDCENLFFESDDDIF